MNNNNGEFELVEYFSFKKPEQESPKTKVTPFNTYDEYIHNTQDEVSMREHLASPTLMSIISKLERLRLFILRSILAKWRARVKLIVATEKAIIIQNYVRYKVKCAKVERKLRELIDKQNGKFLRGYFYLWIKNAKQRGLKKCFKLIFHSFIKQMRKEVLRRSIVKLTTIIMMKFIYNLSFAFKNICLRGTNVYRKQVISVCRIQSFYRIYKCKGELRKECLQLINKGKNSNFCKILNTYKYHRCIWDIKTLFLALQIRYSINHKII
jgi:hypothetical protein